MIYCFYCRSADAVVACADCRAAFYCGKICAQLAWAEYHCKYCIHFPSTQSKYTAIVGAGETDEEESEAEAMERQQRKERARKAREFALRAHKRPAPEESEEQERKLMRSEMRELEEFAQNVEVQGYTHLAALVRYIMTAERIDEDQVRAIVFENVTQFTRPELEALCSLLIIIVTAPRFPDRLSTLQAILRPGSIDTGYVHHVRRTTVLHEFFGLSSDERYFEVNSVCELLLRYAKSVHFVMYTVVFSATRIGNYFLDDTPLHRAIENEYINGIRMLTKRREFILLRPDANNFMTELELAVSVTSSPNVAYEILELLLQNIQIDPHSYRVLIYHRESRENYHVEVNFLFYLLRSKWVRQLLPLVLRTGLLLYNDGTDMNKPDGILYSNSKLALIQYLPGGTLTNASNETIERNLPSIQDMDEYVLDLIVEEASLSFVKENVSPASLLRVRERVDKVILNSQWVEMNALLDNGLMPGAFTPNLLFQAIKAGHHDIVTLLFLPLLAKDPRMTMLLLSAAKKAAKKEQYRIMHAVISSMINPIESYYEVLREMFVSQFATFPRLYVQVYSQVGLQLISLVHNKFFRSLSYDNPAKFFSDNELRMAITIEAIYPNSCILGTMPLLCWLPWRREANFPIRNIHEYLLDHGANPNSTMGQVCEHTLGGVIEDERLVHDISEMSGQLIKGTSAIMMIVLTYHHYDYSRDEYFDLLRLFLERGADVYQSNVRGDTYASLVLSILATQNPTEVKIRAFFEDPVKVDLNRTNAFGRTPVYHLLHRNLEFKMNVALALGARLDIGGDFFSQSLHNQRRLIAEVIYAKSEPNLRWLLGSGKPIPLDSLPFMRQEIIEDKRNTQLILHPLKINTFSALEAAVVAGWPTGFQLLMQYETPREHKIPVRGIAYVEKFRYLVVEDYLEESDTAGAFKANIGDMVVTEAIASFTIERRKSYLQILELIADRHDFWGLGIKGIPLVEIDIIKDAVDNLTVWPQGAYSRFITAYTRVKPISQDIELTAFLKIFTKSYLIGDVDIVRERLIHTPARLLRLTSLLSAETLDFADELFFEKYLVLLWLEKITTRTLVNTPNGLKLPLISAIWTLSGKALKKLSRNVDAITRMLDELFFYFNLDFNQTSEAFGASGVTPLMFLCRSEYGVTWLSANRHSYHLVLVSIFFARSNANARDSLGRNAFDHFLEVFQGDPSSDIEKKLVFLVRALVDANFDFEQFPSAWPSYMEAMWNEETLLALRRETRLSVYLDNKDGIPIIDGLVKKFGVEVKS